MKIKLLLLAIAVGIFTFSSCQEKKSSGKLTNQVDSLSYTLGVDIGTSMKRSKIDKLNVELFAQAIKQILDNDTTHLLFNQQSARMFLQSYFMQKQQQLMAKNAKEGKDFLEKNKSNKDVKVTASGLQYIVLKEGNGPKPAETDVVKVNYVGTLINGEEFDKSGKEPAQFPVNGVIKGWTEALTMMPVGSKWKLFIPSELAYGPQAPGGKIEPNMTLVFEVELLSIEPKEKKK